MTTLLKTHLGISLSAECHSKSSIQSIFHPFPCTSTQSCTPSSLCIKIYTKMPSICLCSLSTTASICNCVHCPPYTLREKVIHTGWLIYCKCTQSVVLINNRQGRGRLSCNAKSGRHVQQENRSAWYNFSGHIPIRDKYFLWHNEQNIQCRTDLHLSLLVLGRLDSD